MNKILNRRDSYATLFLSSFIPEGLIQATISLPTSSHY